MKKFFLFCLLLLMHTLAWADKDMQLLFEQANKQYLKGEYATAVETYEKILRRGFEAPELYFNLANAYYKANNLPAAILNYERAQRLAPGNEDVNFNLELSNLQIPDRIEPAPQLFYEQWWNNLSDTFSARTWAVLVIVLANILFLAAAAFFIFRTNKARKLSFLAGVALLLITLLTFALAATQARAQRQTNAIVFAPKTYLKDSPDKKSTSIMVIREGNKVTVVDQVGEWRKIRLANGSIGWVPVKVIQVI